MLWKALSGVINRRIGATIQFRDVLYKFQARQGTGTDSPEVKILQQLTTMRKEDLKIDPKISRVPIGGICAGKIIANFCPDSLNFPNYINWPPQNL